MFLPKFLCNLCRLKYLPHTVSVQLSFSHNYAPNVLSKRYFGLPPTAVTPTLHSYGGVSDFEHHLPMTTSGRQHKSHPCCIVVQLVSCQYPYCLVHVSNRDGALATKNSTPQPLDLPAASHVSGHDIACAFQLKTRGLIHCRSDGLFYPGLTEYLSRGDRHSVLLGASWKRGKIRRVTGELLGRHGLGDRGTMSRAKPWMKMSR